MIHFLGDLHLSPATPGITQLFADYLDPQHGAAAEAEAVYLLGDLFEAWPGDDCLDADPYPARIAAALRRLAEHGVALYFLHGNRDFLLGSAFAEAAGLTLLPDPYVLSRPTWQFVLTHGDALCTDDQPYQQFRQEVRSPQWQQQFLARPLAERQALIAELRARSEQTKREKSSAIMDVNAGTTEDFLRQYGYATLIHGHTHRPDRHDHIVDGIHCERWVSSDWRQAADGSASGDYLAWDDASETLSRHRLHSAA